MPIFGLVGQNRYEDFEVEMHMAKSQLESPQAPQLPVSILENQDLEFDDTKLNRSLNVHGLFFCLKSRYRPSPNPAKYRSKCTTQDQLRQTSPGPHDVRGHPLRALGAPRRPRPLLRLLHPLRGAGAGGARALGLRGRGAVRGRDGGGAEGRGLLQRPLRRR